MIPFWLVICLLGHGIVGRLIELPCCDSCILSYFHAGIKMARFETMLFFKKVCRLPLILFLYIVHELNDQSPSFNFPGYNNLYFHDQYFYCALSRLLTWIQTWLKNNPINQSQSNWTALKRVWIRSMPIWKKPKAILPAWRNVVDYAFFPATSELVFITIFAAFFLKHSRHSSEWLNGEFIFV